MSKIKNPLKSKKLKYGAIAVVFSVAVIALVIVANAVITAFAEKGGWYSDITVSGIYSVSDEAKTYLAGMQAPVEIKFSLTEDQIRQNAQLTMVYQCAKEFEKESDLISVSYFDTQANPSLLADYKSLINTAWENTNVIVESGGSAAVYTLRSFFSSSSSTGELLGFSGERKFISAFLQLAGIERPIVTFTVGHDEQLSEKKYQDFMTLLDDMGFERREVDLTKEDIDPACNLVIILDPQRDFIGGVSGDIDTVSEIDRLEKYLDRFGSLMVFKGVTGFEFPILDEYLSEWGIKIDSTRSIKDADPITVDGLGFIGTYVEESSTAASVTKNMRGKRTAFYNAAPIEILFTEKETEAFNVSAMYRTSAAAQASASSEEAPAVGTFNVAVMAMKMKYVENTEMRTYLFACGSPEMLTECASQSYANRELLRALISQYSKATNIIDLDYKAFEDYGLPTITANNVRNWTVLLAGVLPVGVLIVGCVVCIRRKYK